MRCTILIAPTLAALLGAACAAAPAPAPEANAGALDEVLQAVRADAVRRGRVAPEALGAPRVEPVVWPDGSLGCAQPGIAYTMAVVPGWRIGIDAGGTPLDYHASRRGAWVWCPPGRARLPSPGAQR